MEKKMKNWKEKWSYSDAIRFLFRESAKRTKGIGIPKMAADACICLLKYGATFHDYMNLRFYRRGKAERETFLTTKMVQREVRKWDKEKKDQVDDKKKFNQLFSDFMDREWIELDEVSVETFEAFFRKHKEVILKPKRESSGIGIGRYKIDDVRDIRALYEEKKGYGLLCEEVVRLEKTLAALNPYSKSHLRVVTVVGKKGVHILAATLRIGETSEVTYNAPVHDLFCQVDRKTGVCSTSGADESGFEYETHPVSGIRIRGFQVPKYKEMLDACRTAALRVPEVRVIGWDVTVNEKGNIVFFEGNPGSGVASMQMADGIGKKELFYRYLK